MAIIKQRNPILWHELTVVNSNDFAVGLINFEDCPIKIPKVLQPLFVKRTTFWKNISLGYKFQMLNNGKVINFSTNDFIELKNIASSLCKAAHTRDITPRYDICVKILSLYNDQKYSQELMNFKDIYILYRSLKWIIISYFCFNQEMSAKVASGTSPTIYWIFGIITRLIFPSDSQPPFGSKLRMQEGAHFFSKISQSKLEDHPSALQTYCSFQIPIIATIINLKLSMCSKNSIVITEWKEIHRDIHDFLLLIESICHILAINILKTKKSTSSKFNKPAYLLIFEKRTECIPSFFISRIRSLKSDIHWSRNVKYALYSMLDAVDMISWSEVRYVPGNEKTVLNDSETIHKMGKYILAALLVIGDLDLCSRFRMINFTKQTEHLLL